MKFAVKLLISLAVIVLCTQVGKRYPSLGGLIATMPLTGLIVLVWLYSENPGDKALMVRYTKSALWGIIPSIAFFTVSFLLFSRGWPLPAVLGASFAAWLVGAFIHQWVLH